MTIREMLEAAERGDAVPAYHLRHLEFGYAISLGLIWSEPTNKPWKCGHEATWRYSLTDAGRALLEDLRDGERMANAHLDGAPCMRCYGTGTAQDEYTVPCDPPMGELCPDCGGSGKQPAAPAGSEGSGD